MIIEYYFMIIHFLLLQRLKMQKPADWLRLPELKQSHPSSFFILAKRDMATVLLKGPE